jgi:hypothetical protein
MNKFRPSVSVEGLSADLSITPRPGVGFKGLSSAAPAFLNQRNKDSLQPSAALIFQGSANNWFTDVNEINTFRGEEYENQNLTS